MNVPVVTADHVDGQWPNSAVDRTAERRLPAALRRRRLWIAALVLTVVWAWHGALAGGQVLNPSGIDQLGQVASAAVRPDLTFDFLRVLARATATTLAYAVLGTALALLLGIPGGVLTSQRWWAGAGGATSHGARRWWYGFRVASAVPRGLHEAVLAVLLVQVLGRDPLVAILAIGVPFGAITAKVVADIIDTTDSTPFDALRHAGCGRLAAMMYGIAPTAAGPVAHYGLYRLECAIRSATVLGVIGAGGLGFELALSFQSLQFEQVWTIVYVLALLAAVVDVATRSTARRAIVGRRVQVGGALSVVALAAWWLAVDATSLWSGRTARLAGDLIDAAWPPRLPDGGWSTLATATAETLAMSIVAISLAMCLAAPGAVLAARRPRGRFGSLVTVAVRVLAVLVRSVPPPVWALIVLYVVRPGPLAAGVALGLGAAAVLTRLGADAIDASDQRPRDALRAAGAARLTAGAYGALPEVVPRFVGLGTYRWEVTMRDTVVVGMVGAGGLGRLLAEQQTSFDEAAMSTTIVTLLLLALAADLIGIRLRHALR